MRKIVLMSLMALVIFAAGCTNYGGNQAPPAQPPATSNSVAIQNFAFNPPTLTIKAGTTVTWTNRDSVAHTVTSDSGAFDSGQLSNGQTYSHTFNDAGTFSYHCSNHPSMKATIVVQ